MDPQKWKSVVIDIEAYMRLKSMARREHRTLSGQFRHVLEQTELDRSIKEIEKEAAK